MGIWDLGQSPIPNPHLNINYILIYVKYNIYIRNYKKYTQKKKKYIYIKSIQKK